MTSLTDTQIVTASGGLVELGYSEITSSVMVSSTSFASPNLIISGPTVVCDGSPVMIEFSGRTFVAQDTIYFSLYRDGAELKRYWASRATGTGIANYETITVLFRDTPTAGSHTYSLYAHNASSTTNQVFVGAGSPYPFLRVSKIVQATQWPAVTTGTIICTSSTRPASPFEGQTIYETDNSRQLVWNGSAWVAPSVTYRPPMCKVRRTSNVTSYGSSTEFTWQAEDYDTDAMWTSGTDVTINTDGVYVLTFEGLASIATSWSLVEPKILVNGTAVAQNIVAFWGTFARWTVATAVPLVATDTVTASLGFLGTGAVTVYGGASPSIDGARLAVVWQGQAS